MYTYYNRYIHDGKRPALVIFGLVYHSPQSFKKTRKKQTRPPRGGWEGLFLPFFFGMKPTALEKISKGLPVKN